MTEPLSKRALVGEPQHPATISEAVTAQWPCSNLTIGGGVAIFHVASARVVVCYHTRGKYWFLPKGRRDAHEHSEQAAEREGYEESGYRNRLLPLPLAHRQPMPQKSTSSSDANIFVTEPVWTMLMPLRSLTQYVLFWYIAETLPPALEEELNAGSASTSATAASTASTATAPATSQGEKTAPAYQYPPRYPAGLTLKERQAMEPAGYEPPRHAGTGVDEEEAQYASYLLSVPDALEKLQGTVLADVVRKGWEAIELRKRIEEGSVVVTHSRGELDVHVQSAGEN